MFRIRLTTRSSRRSRPNQLGLCLTGAAWSRTCAAPSIFMNTASTKTCSHCHAVLPISEFYSNSKSRDGLMGWCKTCVRTNALSFNSPEKCRIRYFKKKGFSGDALLQRLKKKKSSIRLPRNRKRTPLESARNRLRVRIREALKHSGKHSRTNTLLGCSPDFAIEKLTGGDLRALNGMHIDHYIPISFFDITNQDQLRICFNWRNLRIIPAKDNLSKGCSLPADYQERISEICSSVGLSFRQMALSA